VQYSLQRQPPEDGSAKEFLAQVEKTVQRRTAICQQAESGARRRRRTSQHTKTQPLWFALNVLPVTLRSAVHGFSARELGGPLCSRVEEIRGASDRKGVGSLSLSGVTEPIRLLSVS
jgi:hypothetical protein